jgi:hypothetical protein
MVPFSRDNVKAQPVSRRLPPGCLLAFVAPATIRSKSNAERELPSSDVHNKLHPAPGLITDTTEASFLADVIEASQTLPVIVDIFPHFLCANRKSPPPSRGHASLENASLLV